MFMHEPESEVNEQETQFPQNERKKISKRNASSFYKTHKIFCLDDGGFKKEQLCFINEVKSSQSTFLPLLSPYKTNFRKDKRFLRNMYRLY